MNPNADVCKVCQNKSKARLWICCDKCQYWFHMKCVGITRTKAYQLVSWNCCDCSKTDTDMSFIRVICICNDANLRTRLVVKCDSCSLFFYSNCIRVMEKKSSGIWLCPRCCATGHISSVDVGVGDDTSIDFSSGSSKHQTMYVDVAVGEDTAIDDASEDQTGHINVDVGEDNVMATSESETSHLDVSLKNSGVELIGGEQSFTNSTQVDTDTVLVRNDESDVKTSVSEKTKSPSYKTSILRIFQEEDLNLMPDIFKPAIAGTFGKKRTKNRLSLKRRTVETMPMV